ncbi:type II toxin-antitoxin system PemK/MazF family toxin [Patescibacteria group bacterium]|nr:type II toxin-antitoxin system PemK/MazF family toxin [Patescibacteria group bacterium]
MVKEYTPKRGDIVFINFNPQAGKEQRGKRPALVISPTTYNQKVGLALMLPITNKIKNYPFEVLLPKTLKTKGAILSDHIKSLDWVSRKAKFIEKLPSETYTEVVNKMSLLIN